MLKVAESKDVFHFDSNLQKCSKNVPNDYPKHLLSMWILSAQDSFWHIFWNIAAKVKHFLRLSRFYKKRFKQVSYLLRKSDTIKTVIMRNNFKALSDAIMYKRACD